MTQNMAASLVKSLSPLEVCLPKGVMLTDSCMDFGFICGITETYQMCIRFKRMDQNIHFWMGTAAALCFYDLKKLSIYARKVPQLLGTERIKLNAPLQQYSIFRNHSTLLNRKQRVFPAAEISSSLIIRSLLHTTPVCATTYERKLWREPRVIDRFYRLHWGAWIRCRGGRYKGLYKKTSKKRWELKQHIFCNMTQSKLLDKLVTGHWKQPKYFVDTPYELYHKRTNCVFFPEHKKFYP